MERICSDLDAQYRELDGWVAGLTPPQWARQTPFFHWTVFDQVAHVAFFDHEALLALEDPDRFRRRAGRVMEAVAGGGRLPDTTNPLLGPQEPAELLALWRAVRARLLQRLGAMDQRDRLPWYGPDMSARSFATARLMETWAHGQDVCDTLGIRRENGGGLRHVAQLGVMTFGWSFTVRGLPAPELKPRVELTGPQGQEWQWGEPAAAERVWGGAEDFCLVVTQRRNVADTGLQWNGAHVAHWLRIAQAFAGAAQAPPAPGVRPAAARRAD